MLIEAVFTAADNTRSDIERQQLDIRFGNIIVDISGCFAQIEGDCTLKLIENVIKPAYTLHRAMQSSRTSYKMVWPGTRYHRPLSHQALTKATLRNIQSSQIVDAGSVRNGLYDLYPALTVCEQGSDKWEVLVAPVVLTD